MLMLIFFYFAARALLLDYDAAAFFACFRRRRPAPCRVTPCRYAFDDDYAATPIDDYADAAAADAAER